ncbi:MAG: hypothetical protein QM758_18305 [Armatimonas sp.]
MTLFYTYRNGTVPPPNHYEFAIRLEKGKPAVYEFRPGYPGMGNGVELWKETFSFSEAQRAALYKKLVALGLTKTWQELPKPPVGGGLSVLGVTESGKTYRVPSFVTDEAAARKLFQVVEGIVPPALVKKQMARYEAMKKKKGPGIQ